MPVWTLQTDVAFSHSTMRTSFTPDNLFEYKRAALTKSHELFNQFTRFATSNVIKKKVMSDLFNFFFFYSFWRRPGRTFFTWVLLLQRHVRVNKSRSLPGKYTLLVQGHTRCTNICDQTESLIDNIDRA